MVLTSKLLEQGGFVDRSAGRTIRRSDDWCHSRCVLRSVRDRSSSAPPAL